MIVEETIKNKIVEVAYCKEGFKNRLKFVPTEDAFCPVCAQAAAIMRAKIVMYMIEQDKIMAARPLWKKFWSIVVLTFNKK